MIYDFFSENSSFEIISSVAIGFSIGHTFALPKENKWASQVVLGVKILPVMQET